MLILFEPGIEESATRFAPPPPLLLLLLLFSFDSGVFDAAFEEEEEGLAAALGEEFDADVDAGAVVASLVGFEVVFGAPAVDEDEGAGFELKLLVFAFEVAGFVEDLDGLVVCLTFLGELLLLLLVDGFASFVELS